MKKKIFVLFLTACFLSAPISAKAMMFDAIPKVGSDYAEKKAELFAFLETIGTYQQQGSVHAASDINVVIEQISAIVLTETESRGLVQELLYLVYIFTRILAYNPILVLLIPLLWSILGGSSYSPEYLDCRSDCWDEDDECDDDCYEMEDVCDEKDDDCYDDCSDDYDDCWDDCDYEDDCEDDCEDKEYDCEDDCDEDEYDCIDKVESCEDDCDDDEDECIDTCYEKYEENDDRVAGSASIN